MKKLFYLASIIVAAVLAVSCEKGPQDGGNDITNASFVFSLKTTEVGIDYAKISVKHNGPEEVSWYGFVAEDNKSTNDLIMEKYSEFLAAGAVKGLKTSTNRTVTVNGLKSNTNYKFIVFAITEDAKLYNNVEAKSVTFTTSGFLLSQTDDWKVSYLGREENEESYTVEFKANATRCHIAFIGKWLVEYYEKMEEIKEEIDTYGGLRLQLGESVYLFSILDYLVWEELYEYWGYYDESKEYFNEEAFAESSQFRVPRQESGEYYAVAIGFTENGEPTLTYSSVLIDIQKETASAEYNNWLGSWTFEGANGVKYNITFEENDPNFLFYAYGWECSESIHDKDCKDDCTEHMLYTDFSQYELGIPFYFDALTGKMNIKSVLIGAEESGDSYIYWGMYGYTEYQEQPVAILSDGDIIASAAQPADSKSTLNGNESYTYNYDAEGNATRVDFTYNSLGYTMYDSSYSPGVWNDPMVLPASIERAEDAPEASAFRMKSGQACGREEQAMKRFNEIKTADYSRLTKSDIRF